MLHRFLSALALAGALLCASCAGNTPVYAATTVGLQPFFAARLEALLHALPGVTITSGYRSPGSQAALYARARHRYGRSASWMVAPPGRSMHQAGLAADLHFPGPGMRAAAHVAAARFGLTFPLSWESWHIEPIGARQIARGGMPTAALAYAPAAPSIAAAVPWPIHVHGHHVRHRHAARHHHHWRYA